VKQKGREKKNPQPSKGLVGGAKRSRKSVGAQQPPGAAQSGGGGGKGACRRRDKGRPTIRRCGDGGQKAAAQSLPRRPIRPENFGVSARADASASPAEPGEGEPRRRPAGVRGAARRRFHRGLARQTASCATKGERPVRGRAVGKGASHHPHPAKPRLATVAAGTSAITCARQRCLRPGVSPMAKGSTTPHASTGHTEGAPVRAGAPTSARSPTVGPAAGRLAPPGERSAGAAGAAARRFGRAAMEGKGQRGGEEEAGEEGGVEAGGGGGRCTWGRDGCWGP